MRVTPELYPPSATIGATVSYKHRQCPASHGQDDKKARLNVTRTEKGLALWKCHHCGEAGKMRIGGSFAPVAIGKPKPQGVPEYPDDFSYRLPIEAELWLQKGGVSIERAKYHRIGYTRATNSLVIPVHQLEDGKPVGHILRALDDSAPTRYLTRFKPERKLAGLKKGLECCVLVEDWISAIRIADLGYTAVCLLGTSLSKQGYWELVNTNYSHYLVWLDNDSELVRGKARSIQATMIALGKECSLHTGSKEPKRLTDREIADTMLSVIGTDSYVLSNSLST